MSTDPPYYDNIGYSDLSDFFLRLASPVTGFGFSNSSPAQFWFQLTSLYNPYRHGGSDGAREFFEAGFEKFSGKHVNQHLPNFPITVYYAFKQSETTEGGKSTVGKPCLKP